MALAFASGLIVPQMSATCTDLRGEATKPNSTFLETLAQKKHGTPARRAYYLLCIADSYLRGESQKVVEDRYSVIDDQLDSRRWQMRGWDSWLCDWMCRCSSKTAVTQEKSQLMLANTAVIEAVKQLNISEDQYAKLCLLYISSVLYQQLKNEAGTQQCNTLVEQTLQACERSKTLSNTQASAALDVLDAQAYFLIPLAIRDWHTPGIKAPENYGENEFEACKKLKLRGLAIADKLPTTEHVRRKAHRDLALWYQVLGREKLAEEEKKILYRMVGCSDEKILYPQVATCGSLEWWQKESVREIEMCGMG